MLVRIRSLTVIMILLTVSYNFVNFDILDRLYNASGTEAIGAEVGIYVREGLLVEDLNRREASQNEYLEKLLLPVNSR